VCFSRFTRCHHRDRCTSAGVRFLRFERALREGAITPAATGRSISIGQRDQSGDCCDRRSSGSGGLLGTGQSDTPFLPPNLVVLLRGLGGLEHVDTLTIRRLLSHTSGLPDYFFREQFQARVQRNPNRIWYPAELVEAAAEANRLAFVPGSDFSYGDTGYVLVGLAIERLVDRPLADAYRSLIFHPLQMDATYLEWHEPPRGFDVSHHYDGQRDLLPLNTSYDWAGGGLVTTADDLLKFLHGLFGGALFNERWSMEMATWRDGIQWAPDSSARYLRYGLGIGVNLACGEEIFGATGVWGAFAYFWSAGGAAISGTVNLRGADRSILLDAVVCALRSVKR
jgi:CubicO group peptidase (beta-lactamase class C family)